jgi:hypothetical protein
VNARHEKVSDVVVVVSLPRNVAGKVLKVAFLFVLCLLFEHRFFAKDELQRNYKEKRAKL